MKVLLACAISICGRISPAGQGSLLDRQRLEELREKTGASLMGANTLRVENPEMRSAAGALRPERIRAIISRSGNIPVAGKKLFSQGPGPVIFTAEKSVSVVRDRVNGKAEIIVLPETSDGLSLPGVLDFFRDRKVESLLLEGGARLNYSALAAGLVDEILLTILPGVSGDLNAPSFADGPEQLGKPFLQLELLSCEPVSTGELFLHYGVMQ